ncbi:unnamed protein product, partial [Ectocarpus sp. 13 AM-2016]
AAEGRNNAPLATTPAAANPPTGCQPNRPPTPTAPVATWSKRADARNHRLANKRHLRYANNRTTTNRPTPPPPKKPQLPKPSSPTSRLTSSHPTMKTTSIPKGRNPASQRHERRRSIQVPAPPHGGTIR